MNKKIFIPIITVFVLLLIAVGVCLWRGGEEEEEWDVYKYSKMESYTIEDTPKGKMVKNEDAGLEIKVPEGWKAEIGGWEDEAWVNFLNPDAELSERGALLNGIGVEVRVLDGSNKNNIISLELSRVQKIIDNLLENPLKSKEKEREIQDISGLNALRETHISHVAKDSNQERIYTSIKLPLENRLYEFGGVITPNDQSLISEFDKFLEGIKIR